MSANLFQRLGRVIGSYANSLVSSAEDPEKILDQTVVEMQEDLVKMRQASAQVVASEAAREQVQAGASHTPATGTAGRSSRCPRGDDQRRAASTACGMIWNSQPITRTPWPPTGEQKDADVAAGDAGELDHAVFGG